MRYFRKTIRHEHTDFFSPEEYVKLKMNSKSSVRDLDASIETHRLVSLIMDKFLQIRRSSGSLHGGCFARVFFYRKREKK